jgi:hypothetical protein
MFDAGEVAAWMRANNVTGDPGRPTSPGSAEFEAARIRKELAMAVNWEHRNAEIEAATVNRAEYRQHWLAQLAVIKSKVRELLLGVAVECVGIDAGEIQSLIDGRIEQIFKELSAK